MSKKNLHLDFEYDYDFELIAIVSSYRDYRVCWHINKALGTGLAQVREDVKLERPGKLQSAIFFNLFSYEDEINRTKYYLVSNKSSGDYLVPEMKEVDFFLQIAGDNSLMGNTQMIDTLKGIDIIEAVFATDPMTLRSKQNLVFE